MGSSLEKQPSESNQVQFRNIPERADVVVIGGGPAGSSVATLLAKEGIEVVLLEKQKFPRPQVGESILPHMWKFIDMLGLTEKIRQERFLVKAGGIIAWDGSIHQLSFSSFGYTDPERMGLHVERDIFDDLLLKHSASFDAHIYEEVGVREVDFSDPKWPLVSYIDRRNQGFRNGKIACRYVVDASGHASLLARQFNKRHLVSEDKKYLGLWGYYRNSLYLGMDQKRHHASEVRQIKPVTFVTSFEEGWIWHIILRTVTSVGLVINRENVRGMGRDVQTEYFQETCANTPFLRDLLEPAEFIEDSIFFRPDYSYYSEKIAGDNFYCIGDAGGFVDPIFSQGVQAAFYNAAVAAWAIKASLSNESSRNRYSRLAERQMQQYYGFSRLLALGDFGSEGVNEKSVVSMMRVMPRNEIELALAAAFTTSRSDNLRRMARDAGLFDDFGDDFGRSKLKRIDTL
ncbi:MAG: NAD(P)/FAD-dependent oxidoreductase [Candidatus Promineifilaceae bacterium]